MRTFDYQVKRESSASQHQGGRYNPARVLLWSYGRRKFRAVIGAGSSDEVEAFRTGTGKQSELIVVSRNTGLGYVGAEVFPFVPDGEPDVEIGSKRVTATQNHEVFFQSADEALEGEKWEDWSLRYLGKRLGDWLY